MADGAFDPVTAALNIGGKIIDRLWPDPAQADAAKLELFKLQQAGELSTMLGQMKINEVEAASSSRFVSGWRPAVGWMCVAACGWNWIGLPILLFAADWYGKKMNVHPADLSEMWPVLVGMLGIGGFRTAEKIKGVA